MGIYSLSVCGQRLKWRYHSFFFNNVVVYRCTFFSPLSHSACNSHTHTHTPYRTRTLYGIVSISVTAEGLATRDCAGLSRYGPDFTGYKGSRLPLVSNSVLNEKNLCLKNLLIIITEKLQQCNFEYWLALKRNEERHSRRCNYNIYNIVFTTFSGAKLALWVTF